MGREGCDNQCGKAEAIVYDLIGNQYIDKKGMLTDHFYEDRDSGTLKIAEEAECCKAAVIDILNTVYDPKRMAPDNARSDNVELQVDGEKLRSKEFRELWSRINAKSVYAVAFDTDELVQKSVAALNGKLRVQEIRITVEEGELGNIESKEALKDGTAFRKTSRSDEAGASPVSANRGVKYDLIGKMVEETGLTRKTVVQILTGIDKAVFDQFRKNPEEFIIKAAKLINEEKATAIIEHITYNVMDDAYGTDIFTDPTIKGKLGTNAMKANRHLYDHIVYDSENEHEFAEQLDVCEEVAVYVKLPDGFYIPTPVGRYNPDWAIAFREGTVKHIYFVAETKGSMDTLQLRKIEESKIHCAREHFKAISGENVVYDVVDSYSALLDKVMR